MKKWLILGGMTAPLTFIAAGYLLAPTEVSYEREVSEPEVVTEVVEEVDVIDAASAEIQRIQTQLDEEETKLLAEIETIEAEAAAKVAERNARLESIKEIRMSF